MMISRVSRLGLLFIYLLSFFSIERLELIKHLNLRHCGLTVTINIFNDLQSNSSSAGNTQTCLVIRLGKEEGGGESKM